MSENNVIYGINGPVVTIKGETGLSMMEMVYVGEKRLVGEVIRLDKDLTTIQVYEETTGLKPGEPVYATGGAMFATLGPGIIRNIFDGIERPLSAIAEHNGAFISKGCAESALDEEREWQVNMLVKPGDKLKGGDIYGECPETPVVKHKFMVPPGLEGEVVDVKPDGKYKINDTIVTLRDKKGKDHELTLCQRWPIRIPRPVNRRLPAQRPLITGQRVIDTLFPIAKGGAAAIPGGFGTGKTMTQHQLAKW
ncbi:MAG: V-type ATP synthase subunit A, partial [Acutalibacteraceae bacterium]|nr:V-type ATP synthase subunit A [Acutalibacteraceae bacterium]